MKRFLMKRFLTIGCICILIAVALFACLQIVPQLSVKNADTDQALLTSIVKPGDTFTVSYIHSVNKSKVIDSFTITQDYQIILLSTKFTAYGAGIPEPEAGQTITIKKDYIEINNINRIIDPYRFFVGTTADHTFIFNDGKTLRLTDHAKPQSSIIIDIDKVSILTVLLSWKNGD